MNRVLSILFLSSLSCFAQLQTNLIGTVYAGTASAFYGYLGYVCTVGNAGGTVPSLGRYFSLGNSQTHNVMLCTVTPLAGGGGGSYTIVATQAQVNINMAGGTISNFLFAAVTPVHIPANTNIAILSFEGTGDAYQNDLTSVGVTNGFSNPRAVYQETLPTITDNYPGAYGWPNFTFYPDAPTTNWYVDPIAGNDANTGTAITNAFQTLWAAIAAHRAAGTNNHCWIWCTNSGPFNNVSLGLQGGNGNSGADDSNLTIAGYGGTPTLFGGVLLTNWASASNGWWVANLPSFPGTNNPTVNQISNWWVRSLWVDGALATRAVYPSASNSLMYVNRYNNNGPSLTLLTNTPGSIPATMIATNMEVQIDFSFDSQITGVSSVNGNNTITLNPAVSAARGFNNLSSIYQYRIYNTFEGMSKPGQFYFDRGPQNILYYPLNGKNPNTSTIIVPTTSSVITVAGNIVTGNQYGQVWGLTLSNLNIYVSDAPIQNEGQFGYLDDSFSLVVPQFTSGFKLLNCHLGYTSGQAIAGDFLFNTNSFYSGNTISYTGGSGIVSRWAPTTIAFNTISNAGWLIWSAPSVRVNSGATVVSNTILNSKTSAIADSGMDNCGIGYNWISNAVQVLEDIGAFYEYHNVTAGAAPSIYGNIVFSNVICWVGNSSSGDGSQAINFYQPAVYLDEQTSNNVVRDNIFLNCKCPAFMNSCTNNYWINNDFINTQLGAYGGVRIYTDTATNFFSYNIFYSATNFTCDNSNLSVWNSNNIFYSTINLTNNPNCGQSISTNPFFASVPNNFLYFTTPSVATNLNIVPLTSPQAGIVYMSQSATGTGSGIDTNDVTSVAQVNSVWPLIAGGTVQAIGTITNVLYVSGSGTTASPEQLSGGSWVQTNWNPSAIYVGNNSNLIFNGLTIYATSNHSGGTTNQSVGIYVGTTNFVGAWQPNNVVIESCTITNMYSRTGGTGEGSPSVSFGAQTFPLILFGQNLSVSNCLLADGENGIALNSWGNGGAAGLTNYNVTIVGNSIFRNCINIAMGCPGTSSNTCFVGLNIVSNNFDHWTPWNAVAPGSGPLHMDGIYIYLAGWPSSGPDGTDSGTCTISNVVIACNRFGGDVLAAGGTARNTTAALFFTWYTTNANFPVAFNFTINDNLFLWTATSTNQPPWSDGFVGLNAWGTSVAANNTLISSEFPQTGGTYGQGTMFYGSDSTFKTYNNYALYPGTIFYYGNNSGLTNFNAAWYMDRNVWGDCFSSLVANNNDYAGPPTTSSGNSVTYAWQAWTNTFNFDRLSHTNSPLTDSLYRPLASDTFLQGKGTNLTAYGIKYDYFGNAYPTTGNWNIGYSQALGSSASGLYLPFANFK